jgi:hypothetical protein
MNIRADDLSGLCAPGVTVWTAWCGDALAGAAFAQYERSDFNPFLQLPL